MQSNASHPASQRRPYKAVMDRSIYQRPAFIVAAGHTHTRVTRPGVVRPPPSLPSPSVFSILDVGSGDKAPVPVPAPQLPFYSWSTSVGVYGRERKQYMYVRVCVCAPSNMQPVDQPKAAAR